MRVDSPHHAPQIGAIGSQRVDIRGEEVTAAHTTIRGEDESPFRRPAEAVDEPAALLLGKGRDAMLARPVCRGHHDLQPARRVGDKGQSIPHV